MQKEPKANPLLLAFVKLTGILPALLFFKPKRYDLNGKRQRLPRSCILVSNHTSLMDFALYLCCFPFRTLHFLMAEVLFRKGKLFAAFLRGLGGIRVDRDTLDFGFVRQSLAVLDKGGVVGIFPESRLPVNGVHFPFKPSVVFIALHTDAPIVPIYTDGNYGLFKRAHYMVGEKIYLREMCSGESQKELERMTAYLEKTVYALGDELAKRIENDGKKEKSV